MHLGLIIKQYRAEYKMTMDQFSELSGISKAYISMLERGRTQRGDEPSPSIDVFNRAARVMGMRTSELVAQLENPAALSDEPSKKNSNPEFNFFATLSEQQLVQSYRVLDSFGADAVRETVGRERKRSEAQRKSAFVSKDPSGPMSHQPLTIEFPVYDERAAAGIGNPFMDAHYELQLFDARQVPRKADFAIKIHGDSMAPLYQPGDTLFVESRALLEHGELGIVSYNGAPMFKRIERDNQTGRASLVSLNKKYRPIEITESDTVHTLGRVLKRIPAPEEAQG